MELKNERFVMTFCTKGGEMESLLDQESGIQYLYQGNTEYWGGKNPGLFPLIGNTFSGDYEIKGKRYAMKNHGLIRYADLTCIYHDETSITFELKDNEETRKQYPFSFCYDVTYRLDGNKVTITYDIANTGTEDMPFMFGLHPAFLCPLTGEEAFEDYHLIFSNPEKINQLIFDPNKEKDVVIKQVEVQDIPLTYSWITDVATVVYENCRSAYITLQGKEHGVKVSIAGYRYLAIWTPKEGAPFVCIEPWHGHGDFVNVKEDFYHREGTIVLAPNKTFTTSYTIEVF